MSQAAFDSLVLRVATERRARGELDAAFLDAVAVVQGTGGLAQLVTSLQADGGLPGGLTGLTASLGGPDPHRGLASAVSRLAERDLSGQARVQLERARRHLALLEGLPATHAAAVTAELDQLAEDLVARRELP
jgi:hypothetical protein